VDQIWSEVAAAWVLVGAYLRAEHEDVLVAVVVHSEEGELDPLELVLVLRPDVPRHHQVPQDGGRELGQRATEEENISRAALIGSRSRYSAKRRDEDRSPCGKAKSCCNVATQTSWSGVERLTL
jgi:hypothetical protein